MRVLLCAILLAVLSAGGCAGRDSKVARHVDMQELDRPAAADQVLPAATNAATVAVKSPKVDSRPRAGRPDAVVVAPANVLVGKVVRADRAARFVVIAFPVGQMPAQEQRMSVYREGLKVGEVKISGPQRDDKTVGDILAGEATVGDQVRER